LNSKPKKNNKWADNCTDEEILESIRELLNEESDGWFGQTYWKLEEDGIHEIDNLEYFELLRKGHRVFSLTT
jgi:hypothetical protein